MADDKKEDHEPDKRIGPGLPSAAKSIRDGTLGISPEWVPPHESMWSDFCGRDLERSALTAWGLDVGHEHIPDFRTGGMDTDHEHPLKFRRVGDSDAYPSAMDMLAALYEIGRLPSHSTNHDGFVPWGITIDREEVIAYAQRLSRYVNKRRLDKREVELATKRWRFVGNYKPGDVKRQVRLLENDVYSDTERLQFHVGNIGNIQGKGNPSECRAVYVRGHGINPKVPEPVINDVKRYRNQNSDTRLQHLVHVYMDVVEGIDVHHSRHLPFGYYATRLSGHRERWVGATVLYYADEIETLSGDKLTRFLEQLSRNVTVPALGASEGDIPILPETAEGAAERLYTKVQQSSHPANWFDVTALRSGEIVWNGGQSYQVH